MKSFIKNYVLFLAFTPTLFLYFLIQIMTRNKIGNMYSVVIWAIEKGRAVNFDMLSDGDDKVKVTVFDNNVGVFWAIFFELSSGGLLELDGNLTKTIVKSMNKDLMEAIVNKIEQPNYMDDNLLESFNTMVNEQTENTIIQ